MIDPVILELQEKLAKMEKRAAREKAARKQAEAFLEEKSRLLYDRYQEVSTNAALMEAAIVNAKDGVIITTADLDNGGPKIVYVNEAFTRISGYEKDEIIGQTPKILQGVGTSRTVLNELRTCLEKGKSFKGELQNYTKDGIAYWLDISIVPVKNQNGKITHFTAIERDITKRKAFEKEMQIHREAAEVASRAKGDFLANMSHELRTPMNGIIGLSELLTDMGLSPEQNELAEAINGSSRNLLILLNDILDLSKIEANELTLEEIPFDIRRIVHQTVDLLRNIASRKGIVLDAEIYSTVPDRVIGDPARLQQIMNNLVSNAIKFTDQGFVRLEMSCTFDHADDPVLHLRVDDTGIGIPEDKQLSVFNKFTQADVSTARKYGGTGLGLAITKDLVEMMGGAITLNSVEGTGTTFFVEIPVEAAKADQRPIESALEVGEINNWFDTDAMIMVVDDHPVNLLFMRKVLKKLGFKYVDEASSGKEAIEIFQETRHKVIFMDCQMPEMDGFEASTHIREIEAFTNETKIIAVTADAMKGARERCIDSGMNDYISKPVDLEKLKTILFEWIPSVMISNHTNDIMIEQQEMSVTSSAIMDWERLELFTDGNADEEAELIGIFTTYAEESLAILALECHGGCSDSWQKAAHKLKGSAANLGAQALSAVCFEAENAVNAADSQKAEILARIESAYQAVCYVLTARHAA